MLSSKQYWKSVAILGLLFLVVYNVVMMFVDYGTLAFQEYFANRTADGKLVKFIITQVAGMIVYGMFVTYGQFRRRDKEQLKK